MSCKPNQAIAEQAETALVRLWQDVRGLGLKSVFPYQALVSTKVLRNPSTWVMLVFGLAPLVEFTLSPGVQQLVLFLVVYFATVWCAYLYVFVAKRAVNLKLGLAVAAFSLFLGYPLDLFSARIPPLSWIYHQLTAQAGLERLLAYIVGVGVEEELIKAIPVILLAFVVGRVKKPIDGIFFSALSGSGFAINESYKFIAGMHNPAGILGQVLLRTTTLPFLHATWASVSGYFIALAAVKRRGRAVISTMGIALAAIVHGCFDGAPDGLPTICAALFSLWLFVSYLACGQEMDSDVAIREPIKQVDTIALAPMTHEATAGVGGRES